MTPPELKAARMLVRSWLTTAGKPNGLVAFELVESALDAATTRAEQAETRIGQLHQTLVRVTHETPFPHEADDLRVQRAKLMAEVGTLKARAEAAERDQARAALADLASCRLCVTGGCSAHQPLTGQIAALQKQLTQREAECAAMRLLLEGARRQYHGELCDDGNGGLDCDCGRDDWNAEIDAALAPGAGQALLDRLAKAEAERDEATRMVESYVNRSVLRDLDAAKARIDRLTEALRMIDGCIAWSDTMQEWHLLGRDRTYPTLKKVREALAESPAPTKETP